jgi:hypothetical protein
MLHHTAIAKPAARDFANTAPYWLATGTVSLLTTGTTGRMTSPVTFTTSTAVPLVQIAITISSIYKSFRQGLFGGRPTHDY